MKCIEKIVVISAVIMASTSHAHAFNFGFVRVPDWMDSYIAWLVIITIVSMAGLTVTKPRGVPLNQLPNVEISPIANVFRYVALIAFSILMVLVFVGMGLRRYAEA